MRSLVYLAALLLFACDSEETISKSPRPATSGWEAGPTINGRNYSQGVTVTGNTFNIPQYPGSVHYVTKSTSGLPATGCLTLEYNLETSGRLHPYKSPDLPSLLTLYFQRKDDDWQTETYRWFASSQTVMNIEPGIHKISVPMDSGWTAVRTSSSETKPKEFADARKNAVRVGFVFGGGDGLGHGVYSDAPATFTVNSFGVKTC